MGKTSKSVNFLDSTNNSMSKEGTDIMYSVHKIRPDKCELYGDFIQSLLLLLFDTYLGDDVMHNKAQTAHFKWCWKTNQQKFAQEGVYIDSEELSDKFLLFMFDIYYPISKKDEQIEKNILRLWSYIFDYGLTKNKADLNTLIDYYSLFEKALNKN
jgi:hypothetical protein